MKELTLTTKELDTLMDMAIRELRNALDEDYEIDDVRWGDDRFAMAIVRVMDGMMFNNPTYEFYFQYDSEDIMGRSAAEQLKDELEYFIRIYC